MSKVLIIGDTHCPAMLDGYVPFLKKTYKKYKCTEVVHIGDLVDWASISFHPKAPSLKNSEDEFSKATKQVVQLYKAFPNVTWLIGNHDALTERQASEVGLPLTVLKDYAELWNVPNWTVIPRFDNIEIDGVMYQHGDRGLGGAMAASRNAKAEYCSVVQGHLHSQAGVVYNANLRNCTFGMQVGCGVDYKVEAMAYGKKYNQKPIVGCGVVLDGTTAIFEPMPL
jgi:predicted phosphodiesterase